MFTSLKKWQACCPIPGAPSVRLWPWYVFLGTWDVRCTQGVNLRMLSWLVVSTHLKNISQIGSFPQLKVKIKSIGNHHLGMTCLLDSLAFSKLWTPSVKNPTTSGRWFFASRFFCPLKWTNVPLGKTSAVFSFSKKKQDFIHHHYKYQPQQRTLTVNGYPSKLTHICIVWSPQNE